jgi:ribosomal protein S18 acetylase RimI-like enzyme
LARPGGFSGVLFFFFDFTVMILAKPDDKKLIVEILTAAFLENKSVNAIVPQDGLRLYRIHRLMDYSFEVCMLFGRVYLSDDRKGCALLVYPELKKVSLKSIWLDLKLVFGCTGFRGALMAMKREAKLKVFHPKERMAYLWFIGVDPKYQRFGLGKKLMEEVIVSCLQDNRPIYLETSTLSNLPWYKKFGFEVYHELDLNYRLFFLRLPLSARRSV